MIDKKKFVPLLLVAVGYLAAIHPLAAQLSVSVNDQFAPADSVRLVGHVAAMLDSSYQNRLLAQDVDHLVEPFRNRTETRLWQSEFWGKWFTSAVLAYRYRPTPPMRQAMDRALHALLATQTPDGYIGNYAAESHLEQWDIWGRKYTLLGLLDYHEVVRDSRSLDAAGRVADHLIHEIKESNDGLIVTKGNYRGMAASSVLEPMVKLYRLSGEARYLDFAKKIVREWEIRQGPRLISKATVDVAKRFPKPEQWYSPEQGQKAYEMMSCYEGLLELYRVTGDVAYRRAVEQVWQNIRNTEINIAGSGASEEMWFGGRRLQTVPITHYQETCVTVTWIKLNQQLLRLTGEAKYADEIERAYYNALLGSLNGDASDWAKYTPLNGQRLPGSGQCGMDLNCCNASGPRGQFTLPLTAVMRTNEGLAVNFYVGGEYDLTLPDGRSVILRQETTYPESGTVKIRVTPSEPAPLALRLRIPAWSDTTTVMINGKAIGYVQAGNYLELKRRWKASDEVVVTFDMRGRVLTHREVERKFAAIMRGPVVLARDSRLSGPPLETVLKPVTDGGGFIQLAAVASTGRPDHIRMRYEAAFVPESYTEFAAQPIRVQLCDYASAGHGSTLPTFAVWLAQLSSGRDVVPEAPCGNRKRLAVKSKRY